MKTKSRYFFSNYCSDVLWLIRMMSVYFLLWGTIFPAMGRELLPLDGLWELSLPFKQEKVAVVLPGTMDEWGKGNVNNNRQETKHLSRAVTYEGEALYRKEVNVPETFKGKRGDYQHFILFNIQCFSAIMLSHDSIKCHEPRYNSRCILKASLSHVNSFLLWLD